MTDDQLLLAVSNAATQSDIDLLIEEISEQQEANDLTIIGTTIASIALARKSAFLNGTPVSPLMEAFYQRQETVMNAQDAGSLCSGFAAGIVECSTYPQPFAVALTMLYQAKKEKEGW